MNFDFDKIAKDYSTYRDSNELLIRNLFQFIYKNEPVNSILETGCGTCNYASKLSKLINTEFYGIDISKEMLSKVNGNFNLILGDCNEELVFENDKFNISYSVDFIHYIYNLDVFFREQTRILKNGGLIYIATHSKEDIQNQTLGKYFPSVINKESERLHSIDLLKNILSKYGFIEIQSYNLSQDFLLTEYDYQLYNHKTLSILHQMNDNDFNHGLLKMNHEIKNNNALGNHSYTILTAKKCAK